MQEYLQHAQLESGRVRTSSTVNQTMVDSETSHYPASRIPTTSIWTKTGQVVSRKGTHSVNSYRMPYLASTSQTRKSGTQLKNYAKRHKMTGTPKDVGNRTFAIGFQHADSSGFNTLFI